MSLRPVSTEAHQMVSSRILHRDTIKKALAELDALSEDFRMEVIEHRRGRKVEELQFRVIPRPQASLEGLAQSAKNVFDLELVERVVALGLKRQDAQDLYAVTDEGALRAAVEHTEQRMKNSALPPLGSAVAYFRDALKKGYAGSQADAAPAAPAIAPTLSEKLHSLREDWYLRRQSEAKALFAELPQVQQGEHIARFEAERLTELASPIAKAWKRDGVHSRIAASTFYRWFAGVLWPSEVTDKELLEFAMSR